MVTVIKYSVVILIAVVFIAFVGLIITGNVLEAKRDSDYRWGFIDKSGNMVIPPEFDKVSTFSEGLAAVKAGKKWGYINTFGEFVIPLIFQDAKPFAKNGTACVVDPESGNVGYIDTNGTYVIPPDFDRGYSFHEGFAIVGKAVGIRTSRISGSGSKTIYSFGFINEKGEYVYETLPEKDKNRLVDAWGFSEGLSAVMLPNKPGSTGRWGYMNTNGEIKIPARYENAKSFFMGLAAVYDGNAWGYIDKTGKYIIEPMFNMAGNFTDGVARVCNAKCSHVKPDGTLAYKGVYDYADDFVSGVAAVKVEKKWGFINKEGSMVISPGFIKLGANGFSGGLCAAAINNKGLFSLFSYTYGYINPDGSTAIDFQFDEVDMAGFSSGLAAVRIKINP